MKKIAVTMTDQAVFSRELSAEGPDGALYRRELPPALCHFSHFREGIASFNYSCPCGCGMVNQVSVYTGNAGHGWKWDGNQQKPTLTPSIRHTCGCRSHFKVTNGEFVPA